MKHRFDYQLVCKYCGTAMKDADSYPCVDEIKTSSTTLDQESAAP